MARDDTVEEGAGAPVAPIAGARHRRCCTAHQFPGDAAGILLVAKLQQRRCRSSGPAFVDKPVDYRWKVLGYAGIAAAGGCFCCRFGAVLLCIKKRLPSAGLPTMLCVHQALEHKM
jgi:hypothetical protein